VNVPLRTLAHCAAKTDNTTIQSANRRPMFEGWIDPNPATSIRGGWKGCTMVTFKRKVVVHGSKPCAWNTVRDEEAPHELAKHECGDVSFVISKEHGWRDKKQHWRLGRK